MSAFLSYTRQIFSREGRRPRRRRVDGRFHYLPPYAAAAACHACRSMSRRHRRDDAFVGMSFIIGVVLPSSIQRHRHQQCGASFSSRLSSSARRLPPSILRLPSDNATNIPPFSPPRTTAFVISSRARRSRHQRGGSRWQKGIHHGEYRRAARLSREGGWRGNGEEGRRSVRRRMPPCCLPQRFYACSQKIGMEAEVQREAAERGVLYAARATLKCIISVKC